MLKELVLRPEGQAIIATDIKKKTIVQKNKKKTMSREYKSQKSSK